MINSNQLKGDLIIISGPSGVGKSTILKRFFEEFSDKIGFSVSYTSRAVRQGEMNGKDYYYVTIDKFKRMIENDEFLEWAQVHDNFYGTSKSEVSDIINQGLFCFLDIDVQGAMNLKQKGVNAKYIFIAPPSIEELKHRLFKRGSENESDIQKRYKNAEKELTFMNEYDYIIVNDDIEKAYFELKNIIFDKGV